jgi:hypothetical protein
MSIGGTIRLIRSIFLFSLMVVLAGCGGGGGGNGAGGEDTSGISYSGLTTPAHIDESNARQLSTEVYGGGSVSPDLSMIGAISLKSQNYVSPILDVSQTIRELFKGFVITPGEGGSFAGSAETHGNPDVEVKNDGQGGTSTCTIYYDELTGDVSGSLVFSNYHSDAIVAVGTITFSGIYDPNTDILTLDCTFQNYKESDSVSSFTYFGSASAAMSADGFSITIDAYIKDGGSEKVCWLNHYQLTETDRSGYNEITISGRYYNPDYGYVDFAAQSPFICYDAEKYPAEGILELTGDNDTSARLIALPSAVYQLLVDADGDGVFEWQSGDLSWE